MANASLASKYRPQTFQDVVGQDTVKAILSHASAQDKIAPAYLLSGTRGVGKTTLARVFAKALNCVNAPTAEPCNECSACKSITQGSFVDVVEMDGASNRGIDDIRKLRESVGYSPLEGRYKVFIIDEAHMLTKEAFNALLKTLEEPPARVVFVLASTEQHKFPITIISRCQHFVFRQVPENDINIHLRHILDQEKIAYEDEAVKLVARRAAGSVRDGMSLLGQSLAFLANQEDILEEKKVREVLGLAGLEFMDKLLYAIHTQDVKKVSLLVAELFGQGVDMSFFLRELTTLWRNLFVIHEIGQIDNPDAKQTADQDILPQIPLREILRLKEHASHFSVTFIHAAWQMTLENQRRILQSIEPTAGLELLLMNLAILPRILPLEELKIPLTGE